MREPITTLPDYSARTRKTHGATRAAYEIDWKSPSSIPEQDVKDFILGQYTAGKQRRRVWEGRAATQLAWARGNQHLVWDDERRDLVEQVRENLPLEYRDPITINKIKGKVMAWLAMMLGKPPEMTVSAQSRDDEDVRAAELQSKLLRYYWHASPIETSAKVLEMMWMTYCTGFVLIKPVWDPYLGNATRFSAEMLKGAGDQYGEESEESGKQRGRLRDRMKKLMGRFSRKVAPDGTVDIPGGDVFLDYASGFDITEPVDCTGVDDAGWLLHSRYRSIEYVRERYPKTSQDVMPDRDSEDYNYRQFERHGAYDGDTINNSESDGPPDQVLVHELWRPHSISAPVGAFMVVADDQLLKQGRHPYVHGQHPFIMLQEMPEPEHFRPGCTVRDLMGLQSAVNKQRSMMQGHLEISYAPRILSEKGNGLPEDAFVGGPKLIRVNKGELSSVKAWEPPRQMSEIYRMDELNERNMEDLAGVHRSTSGRAESGQQSGKHAEILRRNDQARQSVPRILVETAFSKAGEQMLWLLWEFVTEERLTTIPGDNFENDVVEWKGADLLNFKKNQPPGPHPFNVRAKLAVEKDMGDISAMVEGMTKAGYLRADRPEDRAMVFRWLGEQVPTEMDPMSLHRSNAHEENDRLKHGKIVRTALGDDDAVHIESHMRHTTSAAYKRAAKNPRVIEAMQIHLTQHYFQAARKEGEAQAIRKRVQADLITEYNLAPPAQPPAGAPQPGQPGQPAGGPGPGAAGGPAPEGVTTKMR